MKTPDRFNKPYFYTYFLLVVAIVSLTTLVLTLVFGSPGLAFFFSILLGFLALLPIGSALDRLSLGLGRLQIGQPPQVETQRDFWNPLIGLLRQLNRLGSLTGRETGAAASLAEQGAAQQERNRLGRELHDSIKQQLFSIQMSASAVQARWDEDPQGARSALDDVLQSAQAALAEMNALLQQLSPVPLERVGLAQALKDQCEALAYRTGAQVTCEVGELPAEDWLPVGAFEALFRVAQEALSNISRHARPSKVSLSLQPDLAKGLLVLSITDDGLGFDPAGTQPGGGLINMRTRLESLGGSFSLKTGTGKGVQLLAALPVHPPEQAEVLSPVKADPFLNRAALVGLGGGVLGAAALILPVYDSIGQYLDWGWDVSRFLGTAMVLLAMLIGVLTGWLASRWVKPGTLIGSSLVGTLAGLVAGATAFGLIVAGFASVDGASRALLDYGLRPASVAETARLLSGVITSQFQAIHRFFWNFLILGALYGTFGGLLTWRKAAPAREGIAWEAQASLICTLLALGSGLALVAGTPALSVIEPSLFGMHGQAGIVVSTSILWSVLWVLGTPFLFYLFSMIASYGLLRRELQNASSTTVYHAHWRAFNLGLLGLIVPVGMGIGLALFLGDAPMLSPAWPWASCSSAWWRPCRSSGKLSQPASGCLLNWCWFPTRGCILWLPPACSCRSLLSMGWSLQVLTGSCPLPCCWKPSWSWASWPSAAASLRLAQSARWGTNWRPGSGRLAGRHFRPRLAHAADARQCGGHPLPAGYLCQRARQRPPGV